MLKPRLVTRIAEIEPGRWDSVGCDPFSSHAILAALEGSRMEGIEMRYALLEDRRGRALAAAPFSAIAIDAEKLTHGLFRRSVRAIRRIDRSFLRTRLMICGVPLSVGNPPLRIAEGIDPRIVLRHVAGLLSELATDAHARWRAFKEIPETGLGACEALVEEGWTRAPSEPCCVLPVRWASYEEYLAAQRHPYRARIRKAAEKLRRRGVAIEVVPLAGRYDADLHRLYENVLERADVRLESLTSAFFQALGRAAPNRTVLILFRRGSRAVGWVALLEDDPCLYDLFHGIDYEENPEVDLYVNELSATIRYAIERGARRLSLGQSTEEAKSRFGARLEPLWILLRHESAVVNAGLRIARPALFPKRKTAAHRVFRAESLEDGRLKPCACASS